jgi:uncharacterized protein with NRDE domain
MCIAIISTAHPDYAFVLLSNRDEVISRPTLRADWWDAPHDHVLGGRDLQRAERGTWLGITKQGRVAVLTNFREPGLEVAKDKSRGGIVNAYLSTPPGAREETEAEFVERLAKEVGVHDVGGFTLAFGRLRAAKGSRKLRTKPTTETSASSDHPSTAHVSPSISTPDSTQPTTNHPYIPPFAKPVQTETAYPGLSLVSNRTPIPSRSDPNHEFTLPRILTTVHETHALSNSTFEDKTWPKTIHGCQLLRQALHGHVCRARGDEPALLNRLFEILRIDLLPQRQAHEDLETHANRMRGSIYINAEKGEVSSETDSTHHTEEPSVVDVIPRPRKEQLSSTAYGTMKQTVILVDHDGKVTFVERTLWDGKGRRVPDAEVEKRIEFEIEGWWDGEEEESEMSATQSAGEQEVPETGEFDSSLIDAVQDEKAMSAALQQAESASAEQVRRSTCEGCGGGLDDRDGKPASIGVEGGLEDHEIIRDEEFIGISAGSGNGSGPGNNGVAPVEGVDSTLKDPAIKAKL